jgi:hypothetical protein
MIKNGQRLLVFGDLRINHPGQEGTDDGSDPE